MDVVYTHELDQIVDEMNMFYDIHYSDMSIIGNSSLADLPENNIYFKKKWMLYINMYVIKLQMK